MLKIIAFPVQERGQHMLEYCQHYVLLAFSPHAGHKLIAFPSARTT